MASYTAEPVPGYYNSSTNLDIFHPNLPITFDMDIVLQKSAYSILLAKFPTILIVLK